MTCGPSVRPSTTPASSSHREIVPSAKLPPEALSEHARLILTYALCGFANFGSLGILIGGMGAMVPERRPEIVSLGLRSILSGTLATCMSGAVAGMLL